MTELGRVVLLLAISVALLAVAQIVEPVDGDNHGIIQTSL